MPSGMSGRGRSRPRCTGTSMTVPSLRTSDIVDAEARDDEARRNHDSAARSPAEIHTRMRSPTK